MNHYQIRGEIMKRNSTAIIAGLMALAFGMSAAHAQITIKMPDISIKVKPDKNKVTAIGKDTTTGKDTTNGNNTPTTVKTGGENIYKSQRPTATPVFLRNSIYIQAITHNEYWKMKGKSDHSSWVPRLRFEHFYNNDKRLNYTVEYFNPDGSPWFSETLEQGTSAADRTVRFESPSPYGGVLDTKSTAAIGVFGFKITDQDTKQVLFQGKFKVGKFSTANGRPAPNKFDFFVDQDWLMPYGMIGFHHSDIEIGGIPPEVSVWIKGTVDAAELEGRIFYKDKQLASTKDGSGSGVSDYDERSSQSAAAFAPQNYWKRWQFQWNNFRFDNNGGFNRDYYPQAHYADKNPGEYTVKIYRSGTQIRELKFAIGADGRFVVPGYSNQIFLPYHRIIVPVKVIGAAEKWNTAAWTTESFYGNPLAGFSIQ